MKTLHVILGLVGCVCFTPLAFGGFVEHFPTDGFDNNWTFVDMYGNGPSTTFGLSKIVSNLPGEDPDHCAFRAYDANPGAFNPFVGSYGPGFIAGFAGDVMTDGRITGWVNCNPTQQGNDQGLMLRVNPSTLQAYTLNFDEFQGCAVLGVYDPNLPAAPGNPFHFWNLVDHIGLSSFTDTPVFLDLQITGNTLTGSAYQAEGESLVLRGSASFTAGVDTPGLQWGSYQPSAAEVPVLTSGYSGIFANVNSNYNLNGTNTDGHPCLLENVLTNGPLPIDMAWDEITVIPEPATLVFLGLSSMWLVRWRK